MISSDIIKVLLIFAIKWASIVSYDHLTNTQNCIILSYLHMRIELK